MPLFVAGNPIPEESELIPLEFSVERKLVFDLDAYLYRGELYLPVDQLFSHLKLDHTFGKKGSELEVIFPDSRDSFHINLKKNEVKGPDRSFHLSPNNYMQEADEIFLKRETLEEIFNFDLIFDFRKLEVMMFSDRKLPAVRHYERQQRYKNFSKSNRPVTADIQQPVSRNLLNGGVLDWSLNSSHNASQQNYGYGFTLGGQLLGGEVSLHASGSKQYGLHSDQLRGQWRYPVYSSLLRQIVVGDRSHQDKLGRGHLAYRGLEVTNRPNSPRSEFDTLSISSPLEEGWDTELHINNRLIDFATNDDDEHANFEVPLTYGSNSFELKTYDARGRIHSQQQLIQIPRDFLPPGKFEYALTAGSYRNYPDAKFGRAHLDMGLHSRITIGGGIHYTHSGASNNAIAPYLQARSRLGNRLLVEGNHTVDHVSEGTVRYIFPNSRYISFNLKKFYKPLAGRGIQKSMEASFKTSFPIPLPFLKVSSSWSSEYYQTPSGYRFLNLFGSLSTTLPLGINLHAHTRSSFREAPNRSFGINQSELNIRASKRLFKSYLLRPSVTYNHTYGQITYSRLEVGRRLIHNGQLNFTAEHDHFTGKNRFLLRFTLNLPFTKHSSNIRSNPAHLYSYQQFTSGSVAFNTRDNELHFAGRRQTGKAAVTLDPFLDLNNNGNRDEEEPSIDGLTASFYKKGSAYPVERNQSSATELMAYEQYMVEIDSESLSNPLWSPSHETYQIQADPHIFKRISVPVQVKGEVSGSINFNETLSIPPSGGMKIHLHSVENDFSETVTTYSNGEFFYIGLPPGDYTASLDRQQLSDLSLQAEKDSLHFTVKPEKEGDIVDRLAFHVNSSQSGESEKLTQLYSIQVGAFKKKSNATDFMAKLKQAIGNTNTTIVYDTELQLYKCRVGLFRDEQGARQYLNQMRTKTSLPLVDAFLVEISIEGEQD